MPNLLSTPSNWQDEAAGSPPSYWNGTAYEFLASYTSHPNTMTATAAVGDTVALTLQVNAAATHGTAFNVNVNGSSVFANDLTATGAFTFTSAALSAGDTVELKFATLSGFEAYDLDASLTPLVIATNYNCDCDDEHPTATLADLRTYLMIRLGFSAMLASPPPGMNALLDSFLVEAQTLLYQRFRMLRLERWFTWNMLTGTRFYDLSANADTCTKKLDPTRVSWVGVSLGDNCWRPLVCGIDPLRYSYQGTSIPDSYEIRQCIEVFPAPSSDDWKLRIKGDFGLLPFAAETDVTTIDPQAIKLHALAYAKAHYGQPDAANHMSALTTFLGDLTAATHQTRRYVPGERLAPPAIPPKRVG